MAPSEASLPRASLSTYALRYGETDISGFENSGKSLYTPVSAEKGEYNQINRDKQRIDLYQRSLFQGFSTRDIVEAGGISLSRVRESNLDNALHPLFEQQNWFKKEDYDKDEDFKKADYLSRSRATNFISLGENEEDGYWEAGNPKVWELMLPSLRLASLWLNKTSCTPWWHSLLFSERTYQHVGGNQLRFFKLLPPEQYGLPDSKERLNRKLDQLGARIKFSLFSGRFDIQKKQTLNKKMHGTTRMQLHKSWIFIAYEDIEPLIRGNLTIEERLLCQFHIAVTLIHETAHVMGFFCDYTPGEKYLESYFQNEVVSELGFSIINAILGGTPQPLPPGRGIHQANGLVLCVLGAPWPNRIFIDRGQPVLDPNWEDNTQDPWSVIPIRYVEQMQQNAFWESGVNTYRMSLLHMFSYTEPIFELVETATKRFKYIRNHPHLGCHVQSESESLIKDCLHSMQDKSKSSHTQDLLTPAQTELSRLMKESEELQKSQEQIIHDQGTSQRIEQRLIKLNDQIRVLQKFNEDND